MGVWAGLLKVGKGLLPVIPGLSKKLLKGSGKKRILVGAVTTAAGVGMFFIPGAQEFAVETTAGGALALASGLINRYVFKIGEPVKNKEGVLMAGNINDTLEVLNAAVPFGNYLAKKVRGEKPGIADAAEVIGFITKIPAAIDNIKDVKVELQEGIDADEQALIDEVIDGLEVTDKPAVAQHLLKAVLEIGQAVALMQAEPVAMTTGVA